MRKLKNLMFYIALAVALALPMGMMAQERGLFSTSPASETSGSRSLLNQNQNRTGTTEGIGSQTFNADPSPLGSGVIMLIAAGAGYALLKKKKSNK